jgi:hypothetical protein
VTTRIAPLPHPTGRVIALLACLLPLSSAMAQSGACDTLKDTLNARIESTGVRGHSLEVVPARTPLPSDGKVIGTCDGGAFRVVYRRFGASKAPIVAAGDAASAVVVGKVAKPAPLPTPAPASTPTPTAKPIEPPAPVAVAAPVVAAAPAIAATPPPMQAPVAVVAASAPMLQPAQAEAAPPPPRTEQAAPPPPITADAQVDSPDPIGWTDRAAAFITRHWPWIGALVLLPLGGWLWAWRAHRNAYDEAGLPRGPKL